MKERDSQSLGSSCCRCLALMKSEADVRINKGKFCGNANLIVHQGILNIFHYVVNSLCILGVTQEIRKYTLIY